MGTAGAPGAIRTPDPLVRSQILYPTELRVRTNINDVVLPTDQPPGQSIRQSADQRGGELCASLHVMSTVSCKISQLSGQSAARATHMPLLRSGPLRYPATVRPGKAGNKRPRTLFLPSSGRRQACIRPSARRWKNPACHCAAGCAWIDPTVHLHAGPRLPGSSPTRDDVPRTRYRPEAHHQTGRANDA